MSKEQADKYLQNASTTCTTYAKNKPNYYSPSWGLIDSYSSGLYKKCINEKGKNKNSPRINESEGIRPALWIKNNI